MATEEIVARLNAGTEMSGSGGSTAPSKLTNQEIAVAAGMIQSSFDHALMLSKAGAGLGGYQIGFQFESLVEGAARISWDLWLERKRPGKITAAINRAIAELAFEEFMDPESYRERSHQERAEHVKVSRAQWFKVFAVHFADLLTDLHNREARALSIVRRQLRKS